MAATATFDSHELIQRYFEYVRELRNGREEAVDRLVELWHEDGVFEFAGASPVAGTFKGRQAIHVLYRNRLRACGMDLGVTSALATPAEGLRDAALGVVDTEVHKVRNLAATTARSAAPAKGNRVAVGWSTTIATADKRGFKVGGSHTFTFKGGKIASVKVVVAAKPEPADGFELAQLTVHDIGRLSLAAWAVV